MIKDSFRSTQKQIGSYQFLEFQFDDSDEGKKSQLNCMSIDSVVLFGFILFLYNAQKIAPFLFISIFCFVWFVLNLPPLNTIQSAINNNKIYVLSSYFTLLAFNHLSACLSVYVSNVCAPSPKSAALILSNSSRFICGRTFVKYLYPDHPR